MVLGSATRGFEPLSRDRRSLTTSGLLPQRGGRLQGFVPPTSPAVARRVLQLRAPLFLPWVCSPFQVCCGTGGSFTPGGAHFPVDSRLPAVHPGPGFHDARCPSDCSVGRERWPGAVCSVPESVSSPLAWFGFLTCLGVCHVKERLSRLRRSWRPPVKNSALAALSVTTVP